MSVRSSTNYCTQEILRIFRQWGPDESYSSMDSSYVPVLRFNSRYCRKSARWHRDQFLGWVQRSLVRPELPQQPCLQPLLLPWTSLVKHVRPDVRGHDVPGLEHQIECPAGKMLTAGQRSAGGAICPFTRCAEVAGIFVSQAPDMKVISKSWSTLRYRLALVIASDGRQAAGPKKRKPSSSAALFSRTESGGEHLAVPAPEPPRQPCLRELRRHRRRMLRRMECPRCRTGSHHLHHDTTLCIGHNLMPLVRQGQVAAADIEALRAADFDDGQIVEIIAHVALNQFTNYVNIALDVPVAFPCVKIRRVA